MEAGNMSDSVFSDLCRRIRQNDPLTRSLTVDGNDSSKAKALFDCLGSNTELRRLGLDFSSDLPVSLPLLEYLAESPNLRILDLFGIDMTKTSTCTVLLILLKKAAMNNATKEVTLHGKLVKKTFFERVASAFMPNSKDMFILQSGVASSFQQMKYLESLWLEHLDSVVLVQLLPSLRHLLRLTTITLVPIEKESLDIFTAVGALITSSRSLRSLVLYDCFLSGPVMKPLKKGIQQSDTFSHLALHTSSLDLDGIECIQELYSGYLTRLTLGLDVAMAHPLSEILLDSNSTLVSLDMQHTGPEERNKVLANINGKVDQLQAFVNYLMHTVQGDTEAEEVQKPEAPILEELTWPTVKSEDELESLEIALSAMTGLRKFHVDVVDRLDPVGLLRACKEGNVESCTINGQHYDLKARSTEKPVKPIRKSKRLRRKKKDEGETTCPSEVDGIGLEPYLFDGQDGEHETKKPVDYDTTGNASGNWEESQFYDVSHHEKLNRQGFYGDDEELACDQPERKDIQRNPRASYRRSSSRRQKKSTTRQERKKSSRGRGLEIKEGFETRPSGNESGDDKDANAETDIGDFHSCASGLSWQSSGSNGFNSVDQGPMYLFDQHIQGDPEERRMSSQSRGSRHSRGSAHSRGNRQRKSRRKRPSRLNSGSGRGRNEWSEAGSTAPVSAVETNPDSSSSSTIDINFEEVVNRFNSGQIS